MTMNGVGFESERRRGTNSLEFVASSLDRPLTELSSDEFAAKSSSAVVE